MARYTIHFLDANGEIQATHLHECPTDDDVIDFAGDSGHPHAIDVFDGARHVVRFPPWRP